MIVITGVSIAVCVLWLGSFDTSQLLGLAEGRADLRRAAAHCMMRVRGRVKVPPGGFGSSWPGRARDPGDKRRKALKRSGPQSRAEGECECGLLTKGSRKNIQSG